jgi:transcriptional regulator with XRE-family HTH domain
MKLRKKTYGKYNMVGRNIERLRKKKGIKQKDFIAKMQTMGCDINPTSYSKLEGQLRSATDKEIFVIAKTLGVKMEDLFLSAFDEE